MRSEKELPGSVMPEAHLEELDRLAGWYWWHVHRSETVLQLLRRFAPTQPPAQGYLDVGCGPGASTRYIADSLLSSGHLRTGARVVGLDGDARMEAACRRHEVEFRAADLEAPRAEGLRDVGLFTSLDVLEHLRAPREALAGLRSSLAPGAVGVVTVPAFRSLWSPWDVAAGHRKRYEAEGLKTMLSESGFEVVWQSYLFSFAFLPAAVLRRRAPADKLEFPKVPPWLNTVLRALGGAERLWLALAPVPLWTSALAVVRSP